MRRRVHVAQGVGRHQRVDLRRRHRGVPEQLLHDAHVGAAREQVRRERVPEGVRRDLDAELRALGRRADDQPRVLPRQPLAPRIPRNSAGVARAPRARAPAAPARGRRRSPRARSCRRGTIRCLLPLPNRRTTSPSMHVVDVERRRPPRRARRRVEQLEQRLVAQRVGRRRRRSRRAAPPSARSRSPWAAASRASAAWCRAATSVGDEPLLERGTGGSPRTDDSIARDRGRGERRSSARSRSSCANAATSAPSTAPASSIPRSREHAGVARRGRAGTRRACWPRARARSRRAAGTGRRPSASTARSSRRVMRHGADAAATARRRSAERAPSRAHAAGVRREHARSRGSSSAAPRASTASTTSSSGTQRSSMSASSSLRSKRRRRRADAAREVDADRPRCCRRASCMKSHEHVPVARPRGRPPRPARAARRRAASSPAMSSRPAGSSQSREPHGVPVLLDQQHAVLVVEREHRDGAGVVDELAA